MGKGQKDNPHPTCFCFLFFLTKQRLISFEVNTHVLVHQMHLISKKNP